MAKCAEKARNTGVLGFGDMMNWYYNATIIALATIILVITGGIILMVASVMLKIMLFIESIIRLVKRWRLMTRRLD